MAVRSIGPSATHLGPAADRAGFVDSAAIGDWFYEDDTGLAYRKSVAGAWVVQTQAMSLSAGIGDRTPAHTAPTATNASGAMLAANTGRKAALLQNIGTVDVFIKLGATAVASQGILLQANGGSFNMSDMMGNLDAAVINGITASGSAVVLVTEWSA